jgi:hypothetical protein
MAMTVSRRFSAVVLVLLAGCVGDALPIGAAPGPDPDDIDRDGDRISNADEAAVLARDSDRDRTPDYLDLDSDDDTLPDLLEAGDLDRDTPPRDTDDDDHPDFVDIDSDDNALFDRIEGAADYDEDGLYDAADDDDDDDHLIDRIELRSVDPPTDTDHDGQPDFRDIDSDGDSILDAFELGADTDWDGTADRLDADSDGDGHLDSDEAGDDDLYSNPIDTDLDGHPDFRDRDRDADGLLDGEEPALGTNASAADTDGDGVTDLVEVRASTDALDAEDTPQRYGDFVFVLPFEEAPAPASSLLRVGHGVFAADMYLQMDVTASMDVAVPKIETVLRRAFEDIACPSDGRECLSDGDCAVSYVCGPSRRCIADPAVSSCVPSFHSGFGGFEGSTNSYRNHLSIQSDSRMTLNAIGRFMTSSDSQEALYEAVACAADPAYCRSAACAGRPETVGCPGFRLEAARVLVAITDESDQCEDCAVVSARDAGLALARINVGFIGLAASPDESLRAELEAIGEYAGPPRATPLPSWLNADDPESVQSIVASVLEFARESPRFVTTRARELPDDDGDGLGLLEAVEIDRDSGGCDTKSSIVDLDGDGRADSYPSATGSTRACFRVVPEPNRSLAPTDGPRLFVIAIDVEANGGSVETRRAFLLVPQHAPIGIR